jgi:hypothetical protein
MIGMGYGRAMSATNSQRPESATRSMSSLTTVWIVSSMPAVARGVKALDTRLRSRRCSSPSMFKMLRVTLSHSGPDVIP